MKTLDDAKRANKLGQERESLIERAIKIRESEKLFFGAAVENKNIVSRPVKFDTISVEVMRDEFRELLTRELMAQIVEIDKELRSIGIEPEPFDAAHDSHPSYDHGSDERPHRHR